MIVGGAEFAQTEPVGREGRQVVEQGFDGFELRSGNFAGRRQGDEDADPRSGSVTIRYATLDQLDLICQRLTGGPI